MSNHSKIEMVITSRERDLGGFSVRRILPYASHRMVGPFIFFDHMGPANFAAGEGIDVRPHPHINLATVTYLFEGKVLHRDSLGSKQVIEPGAINWMTAGRGIVHSERVPEGMRDQPMNLNGIQLWVALPEEFEEIPPSFHHHPKERLPEFTVEQIQMKLLLGKAFGYQSPVKIHSDLFYLETKMPKGARLSLPAEGRDCAVYCVQGHIRVEEFEMFSYAMAVGKSGQDLSIEALEDSHVMLLGGAPVGVRNIYWNFVSSSRERLEQAKADWAQGPRADSPRFQPIPGDDQEFIPLPADPLHNPKGTPL